MHTKTFWCITHLQLVAKSLFLLHETVRTIFFFHSSRTLTKSLSCHLTDNAMALAGLLRSTVDRLKQERNITPKLVFIHGAHDDTTEFEKYLVEDQTLDGSPLSSSTGFSSFLDEVRSKVAEHGIWGPVSPVSRLLDCDVKRVMTDDPCNPEILSWIERVSALLVYRQTFLYVCRVFDGCCSPFFYRQLDEF